MVMELLVTTSVGTFTFSMYINSSQELFLFLHVVAMLGNVVAKFRNIVGGQMIIMGTLLGGLGVV